MIGNTTTSLCSYCECFSAGLYCDESCTCQECFNRTDYEDTVDEARQQIVSRNPHAFSPKIDSVKQSPTNHNVIYGLLSLNTNDILYFIDC